MIVAGAVIFRLTLYSLAPSLSTDIQRYRWEGRVQNAGWNPYTIAPNDPRLAYLRDPGWAVMPSPEIPAVYPPLSELIFRLDARYFPGIVAFKLPFVLADLLVLAMLAKWLQAYPDGNYRLAIYAWNPLVIVEFAASGHNDALAIAAMIAALAMIKKTAGRIHHSLDRRIAGETLSHRAFASRAAPFGMAPKAAGLDRVQRRRARWPLRASGPIGPRSRSFSTLFVHYQATFQNYNPSLYAVLLWFSGHPEIAAGIGEGIVLGLAIWAAARKLDPLRAAFLIVGAILMFAPNTYSWYFTWIVPLLCFFPNPAWLLATILQFLSYKVLIEYQINGIWHFDPYFQWLAYAPFYALLVGEALLKSRRKTTTADARRSPLSCERTRAFCGLPGMPAIR